MKWKLEEVQETCKNILLLLKSRLGGIHLTELDMDASLEIIPDFKVFKDVLNGGDFRHFVYEFLTNPTLKSYDALDRTSKIREKSRFGKQKIAIDLFMKFMIDFPAKPTRDIDIPKWKGEVSKCINLGIEKLTNVLIANPDVKSSTRYDRVTITWSLLSKNETKTKIISLLAAEKLEKSQADMTEDVVAPAIEVQANIDVAITNASDNCELRGKSGHDEDFYSALKTWNVTRLRKELKNMRLNTSGRKIDLIHRIIGSDGADKLDIVMEWKIVCASKKKVRKPKRKCNFEDDINEPNRKRKCENDGDESFVEQVSV